MYIRHNDQILVINIPITLCIYHFLCCKHSKSFELATLNYVIMLAAAILLHYEAVSLVFMPHMHMLRLLDTHFSILCLHEISFFSGWSYYFMPPLPLLGRWVPPLGILWRSWGPNENHRNPGGNFGLQEGRHD